MAAIPNPLANPAAPISTTASAASTIKNFPPPPQEPLPPSIEDFDELIATAVAKYVEKSKGVDALIVEQVRQDIKLPPSAGLIQAGAEQSRGEVFRRPKKVSLDHY